MEQLLWSRGKHTTGGDTTAEQGGLRRQHRFVHLHDVGDVDDGVLNEARHVDEVVHRLPRRVGEPGGPVPPQHPHPHRERERRALVAPPRPAVGAVAALS